VVRKKNDDHMHAPFGASASVRSFAPPVDVRISGDRLLFVLDVPGLELADLQVQVTKSVLTIAGRRRFEATDENEQLIIGRGYGAFRNAFRLPPWLDPQTLTARLHNGVLTVEVRRRGSDQRAVISGPSEVVRALPPKTDDGDG
jgi:HSP20 family molecular chaperone IbpA